MLQLSLFNHFASLDMQSFYYSCFLGSVLFLSQCLALLSPCPLLGPRFPIPTSLAASPAIQTGVAGLRTELDTSIATSNTSDNGPTSPNTTSFSIALFAPGNGNSLPADPFFFQYHHTASGLANSSAGVKAVDDNSVYRIGPLTQIFTVWTFLVEAGSSYWDDAVTKHVPELVDASSKLSAQQDPVSYVDWEEVTLGMLASHLAGIGRDCK